MLRNMTRSVSASDKDQTPALVNGSVRFLVTMEKKTGGRCEMLTASGRACSSSHIFQTDMKMSGDPFRKHWEFSAELN